MRQENSIVPDFIKVSAVVVALPRWVLALLAADGFAVPSHWYWVHAVSAIFGSLMCVLEGIAIAYILGALVQTRGKQAAILIGLTAATCLTFGGVLTPSIYSRVTDATIGKVLPAWLIWGWSACVALSTIATVSAVGFAQASMTSSAADAEWLRVTEDLHRHLEELERQNTDVRTDNNRLQEQLSQATKVFQCPTCPRTFASAQALGGHLPKCPNRPYAT